MQAQTATILVLEDHGITRSFLTENLSADGYNVIEAEDLGEAHHLLESTFPDLAIVDLGLPDGDGLELLAHVRASDRIAGRLDPDLPLLVLSGRVGELDRLRGFDRGCDDYLVKPFSYHELSARVRALLRRTRHRPATGPDPPSAPTRHRPATAARPATKRRTSSSAAARTRPWCSAARCRGRDARRR